MLNFLEINDKKIIRNKHAILVIYKLSFIISIKIRKWKEKKNIIITNLLNLNLLL